MQNSCLITFKQVQKQPLEMFYKKAVVKNFAGKHLCWSLESVSVNLSLFCQIFKSTYFKGHLQTAASENVLMRLRKIKNCS